MTETLVPFGKYVVVKTVEFAKKTEGGIYIPESSNGYPIRATVLSVGEGVAIPVKAGDTILHLTFAGQICELNNKEIRVLDESELIGKVE